MWQSKEADDVRDGYGTYVGGVTGVVVAARPDAGG
jgi:hypothetical protein